MEAGVPARSKVGALVSAFAVSVIRKQEVHLLPDAITQIMADQSHAVQPRDKRVALAIR